MLIYDKAYTAIKNKYIIPLSEYSVPYRNLKKVNIKEILYSRFTSVEETGRDIFEFYFDQDILMKGLLGDIQLFYLRQLIQKQDVQECMGQGISANWNIVTHYYKAFFSASLLLRLCFRGNIFIDSDKKRMLESLISQTLGHAIKLDSNLFYEVVMNADGKYILKLTRGIDNTHEIVWKKLDLLIDEMLLNTRNKSDENLLLKSIKKINNTLSNTYPSKLRNRVNYQPIYGLEYIDKKLHPIYWNKSWLSSLINFDGTWDDNQIANVMYAYSKYIEIWCDNLLAEYYSINGLKNGILKQFNKDREVKVEMPEVKYVFQL